MSDERAHLDRLWAGVEQAARDWPDDPGAQVVVRADDLAQLLTDAATMAEALAASAEPERAPVRTVVRGRVLRPSRGFGAREA